MDSRRRSPSDAAASWCGDAVCARRDSRGRRCRATHHRLAKLAGEALAAVHDATIVDAIVMASAAARGDIVYTSDVEDLERLRRHCPGVRVLEV